MISRNLRVTLIEDDIVWGDRQANIQQLERNLRNIADDTDLVILPELFTTGFMNGSMQQGPAWYDFVPFTAIMITPARIALDTCPSGRAPPRSR